MAATANALLPRPVRLIDDADVVCPAGCPALAGTGVRCRIEVHTLDARLEPSAIRGYCLADYQACPSWQAEKDAIREGRDAEDTFLRELGRKRRR
jgi:hypothetical protein